MDVSQPATVSTTLTGLQAQGPVRLSADTSVALTAKGRRMAEEIVRSHRLLERWRTDQLGFDWAQADQEAQALAGALSTELRTGCTSIWAIHRPVRTGT